MSNVAGHGRTDDLRIAELQAEVKHLHDCVEEAKAIGNRNADLIAENTVITTQVRDILTSFRMLASVAKWFGVIAGAVAAGIALWKGFRA